MKITWIKIRNFQLFADVSVEIPLSATTYILGPNGAGKTAVLQALSRLFGFDPSLRRIRSTDFHVSPGHPLQDTPYPVELWVEVQFEFPELRNHQENHATIPSNFAHMRLESADGVPRVRIRLAAIRPEADFATVRAAPRARYLGSTDAARLLACCSHKMLFEFVAHVLDQRVGRSMPLVSEAKPRKRECDAAEKCHRKECRASVPRIENS
jgi:predicted ATP-dependent endonuclease of OLD family